MHNKDEALDMFKAYKVEVENQLDRKIKIIRSDRGGEYELNIFLEFCTFHGIIHQTTAPYTPQQNGVAERKNRTFRDMINSMINSSGVPQNLWGDALFAANTILNRIPHKKTKKSSYEVWKGKIPYKKLKVWGCLAKVRVPLPKRTKLGLKTIDCVFIGYAHNSATYRFLVFKSEINDIHINTILECNEVEFFENIFPYKRERNIIINKRVRDVDQASSSKVQEEEEIEPRRSKRAKVPKGFGPEFLTFVTEEEPQSYKAAMESSEAPYWKEAIQCEIESIMHNNTWELLIYLLEINQLDISGFSRRK